ncbi:MAG: hypothetical protein NTZ24_04570 [Deltaproteobacteria bacterium]|nr:hypothetical protein [Deltaproteobacteria bacterium]
MPDHQKELERRILELEALVEEERTKSSYYQRIAQQSGRKRLREIENLSKIIDERKEVAEKLKVLNDDLKEAKEKMEYAYARMRDSRDRLRESLHEEKIIFLVDRGGNIEGITEKVLDITAKSRDFLVGCHVADLIHEDYRNDFVSGLKHAWIGMAGQKRIRMITRKEKDRIFEVEFSRLTINNRRLLLINMR